MHVLPSREGIHALWDISKERTTALCGGGGIAACKATAAAGVTNVQHQLLEDAGVLLVPVSAIVRLLVRMAAGDPRRTQRVIVLRGLVLVALHLVIVSLCSHLGSRNKGLTTYVSHLSLTRSSRNKPTRPNR